MLTEQEIPTPGTLEYQRTGSIRRYHPGYECKWATNTCLLYTSVTTSSYSAIKVPKGMTVYTPTGVYKAQ